MTEKQQEILDDFVYLLEKNYSDVEVDFKDEYDIDIYFMAECELFGDANIYDGVFSDEEVTEQQADVELQIYKNFDLEEIKEILEENK